MAITLECDSCQKSLTLKNHMGGKKIRCPDCKSALTIPPFIDESICTISESYKSDQILLFTNMRLALIKVDRNVIYNKAFVFSLPILILLGILIRVAEGGVLSFIIISAIPLFMLLHYAILRQLLVSNRREIGINMTIDHYRIDQILDKHPDSVSYLLEDISRIEIDNADNRFKNGKLCIHLISGQPIHIRLTSDFWLPYEFELTSVSDVVDQMNQLANNKRNDATTTSEHKPEQLLDEKTE